jgi:thiol-disulfide isomerase/thioredoxin
MNTSLLSKLTVATLLAGTVFTAHAALKVGDTAPDLAGFKLEGTLPDSLKGKVVILDFWASWCGPCAESFPVMDELQKKYGDQGLVIVAVSVDEKAAKMAAFLKKDPVSFTVVRDAQHKLVAAAEPETMPTSFIIDRDGKVRFLHNGFHGSVTRKEYIEQVESLLKSKS